MLGPDCGARGNRWLHSPHQNVIVPRGTAWPVRCRAVACVLSMCHASGAGPTDEARRRIERELDLEEASIACKKEGGEEPPL